MRRLLIVVTVLVLALTLPVRVSAHVVHPKPPLAVKRATLKVFGKYAAQALAVGWCESRWRTNARNGQFMGIWQMGAYERRMFGHGSTPLAQARAAHRYFVRTGRDWSPWACRWAAS